MIKVTIKFNSDFHIGSGLGKANYIDSLFVKDSRRNPIIPGQTLKGVIKDSCVRIANSFGIKNCVSDNTTKRHICPCIICRIFGRESQSAKYLFSPARLKTDDKDREYPVRRRTSIDAETGTAKEKALFSTEVAPQNLEFEFTINQKSGGQSGKSERTLLEAGILWTREIGGNRRRGLGHCRMTI
ncbi:hypothetical protein KJ693_10375, partial [bacterium]|nr:hypothetical protein [bacterium]